MEKLTIKSRDEIQQINTNASSAATPVSKRNKLTSPPSSSVTFKHKDMEQYIHKFNSSIKQLFGPRPLKAVCRKQNLPLVADLIAGHVSIGHDIK